MSNFLINCASSGKIYIIPSEIVTGTFPDLDYTKVVLNSTELVDFLIDCDEDYELTFCSIDEDTAPIQIPDSTLYYMLFDSDSDDACYSGYTSSESCTSDSCDEC